MSTGVNLIPEPRRQAQRARRHRRRWIVALAGYAMLLAGAWTVSHTLWAPENSQLDQRHAALEQRLAQRNQEIAELAPRIVSARSSLLASRSVAAEPDWSLMLALLADQLGPELVLSQCAIEPAADRDAQPDAEQHRPYVLELQGLATDQHAVAAYMLRLEALELFERVELLSTSRQPFGDAEAIGFQARARFHALSP